VLKREVPLAGPVAVNRAFVSFVHMSVTAQGLLIAATGIGFLLADLGRREAADGGAEPDWLLMLPALLAALYLMLSEKVLRDRVVLQNVRDAVFRARTAAGGRITLAEHFLKARTIYHFLMLSCFLFYAAARFTRQQAAAQRTVFQLELGLVLIFFFEFLISAARLRAAYGGLLVDDLERLAPSPADYPEATRWISLVRHQLDTPAAGGVRARLEMLWFLRTLAAVALTVGLIAPFLGWSLLLGPESGRWVADGCIIASGLTFSWFNMRREQFLQLAAMLCEQIGRMAPPRGGTDR
jgi:hypothetical protein